MLMSKSRLEKFLYALYSLDSNDLPTPLSRIEELYKCLVTGEEVPTFEPLSRVEKYLMTILGVYDADSLPNPLSRVEVLLYKLATGDDNLDDVKSFLSEHEELLAELIRNGGVGGNIDIEYVLYTLSTEYNTLYNTAEKPIKSAILTGSTKYRDIDTGDILDTFDETKNLELVSVKMPVLTTVGKNLFDKNKSTSKYYIDSTGNYVTGGSGNFINQTHHINNNRSVSVSYSERIGAAYVRLAEFDKNNNFIRRTMVGDNGNLSFNLNTNTYYIVASVDYNNNYFTDLQIEFSPVATSYKPFKSNILTVNEEVELRGTDNVKDELDLTTGKLTQRTIQIPLNSDYFNFSRANNSDQTNTIRWQLMFKDDFIANSIKVGSNGKCNIIDYYKGGGADKECIFIHPSAFPNRLQIKQLRTDTRFTTSEELELFLLENQAYVVLELATESVKTVDLSVVNQDRNDTKLSTFNDITHVTISSEGLTPEAELEVATKNEEVLNTMSLEMDDISTTQNALQETSNTQSENVDATMLATTEIYEGLL